MNENRARRVVDVLRARGVFAHLRLPRAGLTQFGVRVALPDGREAIWDTDGTAGLEAQVLRNGVLVGFVPVIEGSEHFDEAQVVEAIAGADYDRSPEPIAARPPADTARRVGAAAVPRQGGLLRRLRDGFRA